jgi:hypothetical protein
MTTDRFIRLMNIVVIILSICLALALGLMIHKVFFSQTDPPLRVESGNVDQ